MKKLIGMFALASLVVALPIRADDVVQRSFFNEKPQGYGWFQKAADPAPTYTGACGGLIPNSGGEHCEPNQRPYCWPSKDNEPGPCSCRSLDPVSNAKAC
jgi:hypothetical protein